MKTIVVIPAFNEAQVLASVVAEIRQSGFDDIVIVDDGSADTTYAIARSAEVTALRHRINRGKGAAVKTGIIAALHLDGEIILTMDADGQHNPDDIPALISPILSGDYDVTLGTRMVDFAGMPWLKVIANKVGNYVTWLLYGIRVSDSQSGFRAYSRLAAEALDTSADRYDYDSQVIQRIKKNRLRFLEVPIQVRYTDYSKNKAHKQGFVNGLKTLARMLWDMVA